MRKAFISGVNGQDGAWLAQLLLNRGYQVTGGIRDTDRSDLWRLETLGIKEKINYKEFKLEDAHSTERIFQDETYHEFYHLAAQSSVGQSYAQSLQTAKTVGFSLNYILDALKMHSPQTKFFQAGSAEIFGNTNDFPQTEETPISPINPYGCAKAYAHFLCKVYRESHELFITNGILYNHESELRGSHFLSRKIISHIAGLYRGKREVLELGNLNSVRDWGYAKEYVEGIFLSLQNAKPDSFIFSTGKTASVRDFVNKAYSLIDIELEWSGEGLEEKAYNKRNSELQVRINPQFFRPAEIQTLCGNPQKAENTLGWKAKSGISEIAKFMFDHELKIFY
ncbi:MAG: GDP-mannose 4,6-dehydratase [Leptospiraceae bacterium]|nr:GDP-mannose 4,6-dehydratase [Leptospiraceae bacterium]